jgi:hypothetical protein
VNVLGRLAQRHTPEPVRKALLTRLFADTAAALGRPMPSPRGQSADEVLSAFRSFTARVPVEQAALPAISHKLFHVTLVYGTWLRRVLGVRSSGDVMAAAHLVYRAIGIDFKGDEGGEIIINRCFFSQAYTPSVCQVMSALDAGLLAGLSGGSRLVFTRRITEGYTSCRARLFAPPVAP